MAAPPTLTITVAAGNTNWLASAEPVAAASVSAAPVRLSRTSRRPLEPFAKPVTVAAVALLELRVKQVCPSVSAQSSTVAVVISMAEPTAKVPAGPASP